MDRRYLQARDGSGVRASDTRQRISEAYARANLARRRVQRRSELAYGYEDGPKSANPYAAVDILRARSTARNERNQVFQQEGSGVYGAQQSMNEAKRAGEMPREQLLGW